MLMTIRISLVLFLLPLSAILSKPCAAEERAPINDLVEARNGVIFSKDVSVEVGVCKTLLNCWTPSIKDIEIMEKELSLFLKKSKVMGSSVIFKGLSSYKRKYYGFERGGVRYIHVNGLCQMYWKPTSVKFASPDRLMTDMGPCYFVVDYDVKRHAFLNYYVDGD